jgi:hypothetical protein
MNFLRQSTAVDIALGPFVDATDGVTAETALTISQGDVRLKKNSGNWAQVNDNTAATHEENGWYEKELDATDTDTVGILIVAVNESGALPVWREFQVLEEAVYDALFAASAAGYGTAQTGDSFARLGAPAGASISADIAAIEAQTDDIGAAGAGLSAIPWNAAWDAEVQSEVADALAVYDPPTRTEATSDKDEILTAVGDVPTNAELSTALAAADDAVLAAIAALNNLSQANVRSALGMASANLDTQLGDLPTAAENAAALLAAAVEGAITVVQSLRLHNAALGGKASGLETTEATYRNLADDADRIVATVDADGNRTAVTLTLT